MDFFDVINTRKTIRKYKEDHPPIEDIKRIIDAARLAPSAMNAQNWKFIAIYNDDIKRKMSDSVVKKYDEIAKWEESIPHRSRIEGSKSYSTFFVDAPVVIAVVELKKESYMNEILTKKGVPLGEISNLRPDSSLLSIGGAIENMSLAANALGYGSCWMCAPIIANEDFKEILNIEEDGKIVSLLTIGKPLQINAVSPSKKSLNEVMQIIE